MSLTQTVYINTDLPEEAVIDILNQTDDLQVRGAVDYYFSHLVPNKITPILDEGWMKYDVKTRMKASEIIEELRPTS